ncbi:MAG: HAD family phosphatase [Eubacteriaceae bacterium]|nr:HAD family phosphatase [Eubacteriaceae bacterium]
MKYKGLIFDMDGVLIDSEPIYKKIENQLYKDLNIQPTNKEIAGSMGRGCANWWSDLKKMYHLNINPEDMAQKEISIYWNDYLSHEAIKESIFEKVHYCFKTLKNKGAHLCIASGSTQKIVEKVVELIDIKNEIEGYVSIDDVKEGKPQPDLFLEAAKKMNLCGSNCLVIDDATNGLIAARAANMDCFLFASASREMVDANLADDIVFSHQDIIQKLC